MRRTECADTHVSEFMLVAVNDQLSTYDLKQMMNLMDVLVQ